MYVSRSYSLARIVRLLVPVCAVAFGSLCMSGSVSAQSAPFRAVDTNGDQVLSYDELVRAFGRASARKLLRQSDLNGDGAISIRELRQSSQPGGFDEDAAGKATGNDDGDDDDRDDTDGDDGGDDGGDGGDGGDGDGGDDD